MNRSDPPLDDRDPSVQPPPTRDWTCREVRLARAFYPVGNAACEFCGIHLDWVHMLVHEYLRRARACYRCASARCRGYDAEALECEWNDRIVRRKEFLAADRWTRPRKSKNVWRRVGLPDGNVVRVTVYLREGRHRIMFTDENGKPRWQQGSHASQEEAMQAAFELFERRRADLLKKQAKQALPRSSESGVKPQAAPRVRLTRSRAPGGQTGRS
ncbi:MAG: hypothetical protein U0792_15350 [Gemmataceae bacterium]